MIVEVADSSLQEDRRIKGPLYAAAGVAEYWIVNLVERVVEAHRAPTGGVYTDVTRHAPGAMLGVPASDGASIPVDAILPPP